MNRYLELVIKFCAFCISFIVVDMLMGVVFKSLELKALEHSPYGMNTEYTMWKVQTDCVIIGASEAQHSYVPSIFADSLNMSVYNCGNDGSRFYYQNAMVNGILDRYSPKLIIWSIAPNYLTSPSNEDIDALSRLNPYYDSNDFCKKALHTKSKYEKIKLLSNLYKYNSRLLVYFYKCVLPDYNYFNGYAPLYGSSVINEKEVRLYDDKYDKDIEFVFESTLNRCRQSEVDVVLVFTPRYELGKYSQLTSYKRLVNLTSRYEVPLFEEFLCYEMFEKDDFKDKAHLNDGGAQMFSKIFSSKVKNLYYK